MLDNPNLNKGTVFTDEERGQLGLVGLLPDSVEDIDRQLERVLGHLKAKQNDLERYIYLIGLCDRDETLFYKLLMSDPMRFLPIVYDPTQFERLEIEFKQMLDAFAMCFRQGNCRLQLPTVRGP